MNRTFVQISILTAATTAFSMAPASAVPPDVMSRGEQGVARCHGLVATIVGTTGIDVLHGTAGDDVIVARKGRDTVYGGGGDDVICGGKSGDKLYGGPGDDELYGQKGGPVSDDEGSGYFLGNLIDGGRGDDLLSGGPQGDMSLYYDNGAVPDRVTFDSAKGPIEITASGVATGKGIGTDTVKDDFGLINGSRWNDVIFGVGKADVSAGDGDDAIIATHPKAWLDFSGGPGDDSFDMRAARRSEAFGGKGRDIVFGSPGLDYVVPGPGRDIIRTFDGNDDVRGPAHTTGSSLATVPTSSTSSTAPADLSRAAATGEIGWSSCRHRRATSSSTRPRARCTASARSRGSAASTPTCTTRCIGASRPGRSSSAAGLSTSTSSHERASTTSSSCRAREAMTRCRSRSAGLVRRPRVRRPRRRRHHGFRLRRRTGRQCRGRHD